MDEYKNLPTEHLLELISKYTIDCSRMFKEGATSEEYLNCQRVLVLLQDEIRFRHPTSSGGEMNFKSNISD